jgi:ribosomal protein S13
MPLSNPPPPPGSTIITIQEKVIRPKVDPLNTLKIETDLKRKMLADIAHHRTVGSYVGKR